MTHHYTKEHQGRRRYRGAKCHWDAYSTDLVIKMREAGHSGDQIADALQAKGYPYTRCAVVGKLNRLGMIGNKRDISPTIPTLSTGVVLGTFLERLCNVDLW